MNNKELNIAAWVKEIRFFIRIEKKIAIKTDRFDKFTNISRNGCKYLKIIRRILSFCC